MKTIKTVEAAFAYIGRDITTLSAFDALHEADRNHQSCDYQLKTVIAALNKADNGGKDWTPDWSSSERKYCVWVWFKKNKAGSGFVVVGADCGWTLARTITDVGSRLCLRSIDVYNQLIKHFPNLIQVVMAE